MLTDTDDTDIELALSEQEQQVFVFPIEPFEARYTQQWLEWFTGPHFTRFFGERDLVANKWPVRAVEGSKASEFITQGEFLDVIGTNVYKATQLATFAVMLQQGTVKDGDVVLVLDAWNPAVLQLAYMRDAGKVKFKIVGLLHAGTWDPHDFLTRTLNPRWARFAELGMLSACDALCVATKAHAEMIRQVFGVHTHVTGFPLYKGCFIDHALPWAERPRRVIFPHRLAPEKNVEAWGKLVDIYRTSWQADDVQFVSTHDVCRTKQEYYAMLGSSRVVVSTAIQETWGIAMLEGAMLGAIPVAPNRLSYPEVFGAAACYQDLEQAAMMVRAALNSNCAYQYNDERWRSAMANIAAVCKEV